MLGTIGMEKTRVGDGSELSLKGAVRSFEELRELGAAWVTALAVWDF